MKIYFITEGFPPEIGGIAQWVYGLAISFHKMGHSVNVAYMKKTKTRQIINLHLPFQTTLMQDWQWLKLRSVYTAYYLLKEIILNKPDIVIASTWNFGAFAARISKLFRFKTIVAYHGLEITKKLSIKRMTKLKTTIRLTDLNIAVSHFTKDAIKNISQKAKIEVVFNGIDPEKFYKKEKSDTLKNRFGITNNIVLMTLARVIERKGFDIVIKTLPALRKKYPNIVYIIAGSAEPTYKLKLEKLISELELEDYVYFSGYIADDELIDFYNLCDVYIMLSKDINGIGDTEGFGITYLEANACEKPVIGSKCHGIVDAIENNISGFLIDADNTDELTSTIESLINDTNLAVRIGKQGRERIEKHFTWDIAAVQLIEFVNEIK